MPVLLRCRRCRRDRCSLEIAHFFHLPMEYAAESDGVGMIVSPLDRDVIVDAIRIEPEESVEAACIIDDNLPQWALDFVKKALKQYGSPFCGTFPARYDQRRGN